MSTAGPLMRKSKTVLAYSLSLHLRFNDGEEMQEVTSSRADDNEICVIVLLSRADPKTLFT